MRFAPLALLLALVAGCGTKPPAETGGGSPEPSPHTPPAGDERTRAAEKLKMIALAMHDFESANGFFPAGVVTKGGAVGLSWRVQLLPYLGHPALTAAIKLDEPWDSDHNKKLVENIPPVFATGGPAGHTHFRSTAGQHGLIREAPTPKKGPPVNLHAHRPPGSHVPGLGVTSITDGTSNTLVVVEADPVPWTKPDEVGVGREEGSRFDNFVLPKLGGPFPGGFHGLMADGSVRFFPDTLKPESLRALLTPQGGEVLPPDADAVVRPQKPKPVVQPTAKK